MLRAENDLIPAVLFGYYRLFLRNAAFHSYNCAYLLAAAATSLLLPFLSLPAGWPQKNDIEHP